MASSSLFLKFLFVKSALCVRPVHTLGLNALGLNRFFCLHDWLTLLCVVIIFFYAKPYLFSVDIPVFCIAVHLANADLVGQHIRLYGGLIDFHKPCKPVVILFIDRDVVNNLKPGFLSHGLNLAHQLPDKALLDQLIGQVGVQHNGHRVVRLGHIPFFLAHVNEQILL